MSSYFGFVMRLSIAFGLAFELPLIIIALVKSGVCRLETLSSQRPYFVLIAFLLGIFLTPADMVSQLLLTLPVWFLYELGLLLVRFSYKSNKDPHSLFV